MVKIEQRGLAKYDRLATDAAADLRLPREREREREREKQDGLSSQPALGPFVLATVMLGHSDAI